MDNNEKVFEDFEVNIFHFSSYKKLNMALFYSMYSDQIPFFTYYTYSV